MSDRNDFIKVKLAKIPGWLDNFTAARMLDLLYWQAENGTKGSLFEIGVYGGRSLALMFRSAAETKSALVGLDTFEWIDEASVRKNLGGIADEYAYTLIKGFSCQFLASEILALLGAKARFISVDGSHQKEDVFYDLEMSNELLAHDGIIAADDFLNSTAIGVTEAVYQFLATPRNLVPFGFIRNRLFLCRPLLAEKYRKAMGEFIRRDEIEDGGKVYKQRAEKGMHNVLQSFLGHPTLIYY